MLLISSAAALHWYEMDEGNHLGPFLTQREMAE